MGYCVASCGNLLWIILWGVVVFFVSYYVARIDNLLRDIVWGVVAICYGLLCDEWM